jgi:hypothetical protein
VPLPAAFAGLLPTIDSLPAALIVKHASFVPLRPLFDAEQPSDPRYLAAIVSLPVTEMPDRPTFLIEDGSKEPA